MSSEHYADITDSDSHV